MSTKIILFIMAMSLSLFAQAQSNSSNYTPGQKAERKAESRWTLQGWLEQRDRNRMMDLWLAMNSPSPYEFFLSGSYQDYLSKDSSSTLENRYQSVMSTAGAYSGVIGLEGFYENNTSEKFSQSGGSLNLRIVGNAVQGTHLILFYGYRSLNLTDTTLSSTINQSFAGGDLNMYFTRYFGISGNYKYYIPAENNTFGEVSAQRTEAGVFIDFSLLRIFGSWYNEKLEIKPSQIPKSIDRTGIMTGLKIFF